MSPRRRIAIVVALLGVAALIVSVDVLFSPLGRLLAVTERLLAASPVAGATLFVVFAALSGMLAFFSSTVIVPVAVHAWGPVRCAGLLWLGWTLGAACTYTIGRYLGRPVVARLVPQAVLARYERKASREMPFGLVVLFQLAMPSEVTGYLFGLVRYSFLRYMAVVALSELPYAAGTVLLGESFVERQVLPFVIVGALGVLLSVWAYARLHHKLAARSGPAAAQAPAPMTGVRDVVAGAAVVSSDGARLDAPRTVRVV
jgi:uncharacterized membrane protein YdjX (TVP38/TMEM64 family)